MLLLLWCFDCFHALSAFSWKWHAMHDSLVDVRSHMSSKAKVINTPTAIHASAIRKNFFLFDFNMYLFDGFSRKMPYSLQNYEKKATLQIEIKEKAGRLSSFNTLCCYCLPLPTSFRSFYYFSTHGCHFLSLACDERTIVSMNCNPRTPSLTFGKSR